MLKLIRPALLLLAAVALIAGTALPACGTASAPAPTATPVPKSAASTGATTPAAGSTVAISGPYEGEAKTLTGAGATFPAVLYSKWLNEYERQTGVKVNYQSIGSGGGIKSISDQTVDIGATDGPMTDEQLKAAKGGEILHIPMALGAVVATYNLPGLNDRLKFTGETLAGIFIGEIKKWNDPKLVADNPALADLGYSPLPAGIVKKAEEKILSITSGGARAFPGR